MEFDRINKNLSCQEIYGEALRHPDGIAAYARENGINKNTIYGYRRKKGSPGNPKKKLSTILPKSNFARAEVVPESIDGKSLPDARWVANLIAELVRICPKIN